MPTNLQRLSTCMSNIMAALECPICLDTIPAPAYQCVNGHLICLMCRVKTEKCPVCRIKLSRGRSLLADQVYNSLIDAFDLRGQEESKRRKILKQKLFGPKNTSSKNIKPDIKINLLNSPTCKFLNRLMRSGKCSSAENLTTTDACEKNSKLLNTLDELHSGLKAKSLSSNEIFRIDGQTFSRTTSVLSSRPGSGLLEVQPLLYSKRPASYHGSAEDLYKQMGSDFRKDETLQQNENCHCPCDPDCENEVTTSSVLKHIQEYHEGPLLHFFRPQVELELPLLYAPTTVLTVTSYSTVFIIKILDYSFKSETNCLWVWSLSNKKNFTAQLTIQENEFEITSACPVIPIQKLGWKQILQENLGVALNLIKTNGKLRIEIVPNSYEK